MNINASSMSTGKLLKLLKSYDSIHASGQEYDCEYGHFGCGCDRYHGSPCMNEIEVELLDRGVDIDGSDPENVYNIPGIRQSIEDDRK